MTWEPGDPLYERPYGADTQTIRYLMDAFDDLHPYGAQYCRRCLGLKPPCSPQTSPPIFPWMGRPPDE